MDKAWFDTVPTLRKTEKHMFEEIHVLLCPPPRPVAVKIGQGYRKLPKDLWPMGELAARALQGAEPCEMEACQIGAFLAQLLCQAILDAGILEASPCLDGRSLLSLLMTKVERADTAAKQSMPKKQAPARDGKMSKQHTETTQRGEHKQEAAVKIEATIDATRAGNRKRHSQPDPQDTGTVAENASHINEECSEEAPSTVAENAPHASEQCSQEAPNVVAENAPHASQECSHEAPSVVAENTPHTNEQCGQEATSVVAENAPRTNEECSEEATSVVAENAPHANEECSEEAPSVVAENAKEESQQSGDGTRGHEEAKATSKPETARQRRRRMQKVRHMKKV